MREACAGRRERKARRECRGVAWLGVMASSASAGLALPLEHALERWPLRCWGTTLEPRRRRRARAGTTVDAACVMWIENLEVMQRPDESQKLFLF